VQLTCSMSSWMCRRCRRSCSCRSGTAAANAAGASLGAAHLKTAEGSLLAIEAETHSEGIAPHSHHTQASPLFSSEATAQASCIWQHVSTKYVTTIAVFNRAERFSA
jgi:hypothetical protein